MENNGMAMRQGLIRRYYKIRNRLRAHAPLVVLMAVAAAVGFFVGVVYQRPVIKEQRVVVADTVHVKDNFILYALVRAAVIDTIRKYEGFSATTYSCKGGWPSIGYGHKLMPGDAFAEPMLERTAYQIMLKDFSGAEKIVRGTTGLSGPRALAMAHFIFCLGQGNFLNSSLYDKVISGDSIREELMKWKYIKGEESPYILKARMFELELYDGRWLCNYLQQRRKP
jgi:lysozyme